MLGDISGGQGTSDAVTGEWAPSRVDGLSATLQGTISEWGVGRDYYVTITGPVRDPIVRRIGTLFDYDRRDPRRPWHTHPAVRNHEHS